VLHDTPAIRVGAAVPDDLPLAPVQWAPDDLTSERHGAFNASRSNGSTPANASAADALRQQQELDAALAAERMEHEQRQEQRIQDAYTNGYDEGRLAGEIAEGLRLRNAITAAESALDEIRTHEAKWQHAVEENIAALAIAVARHIVGRDLRTDASAVADLVKRALAEFPIDQAMRIRVNPVDLSLLAMQPTMGETVTIAPNRDVRWMADARIQPGGCIVEGRERIIDGRVDTALERMYRRLTATDA
jgi:flagellar biosynthesis/type III secretory pathway protein FliH